MADRLPRFDPLSTLGADDVNLMAAEIEAGMGVEVGQGLGGVVVPDDAKIVTKVFYENRPSNNAGYVDVEWPGEQFDGILTCIPQLYGSGMLGRLLQVNSVNTSGASLRLYNIGNDTWDAFRTSVTFFCVVIGWRAFS